MWFVGVRCPIDVVLERRRVTWGRGYNCDGSVPVEVERWQRGVHEPGIYDLEVDTSRNDPAACASQIRALLEDGPPPTAFARLAGLAE